MRTDLVKYLWKEFYYVEKKIGENLIHFIYVISLSFRCHGNI